LIEILIEKARQTTRQRQTRIATTKDVRRVGSHNRECLAVDWRISPSAVTLHTHRVTATFQEPTNAPL